jgi:transcriptional accessory protein Tex/SPT6
VRNVVDFGAFVDIGVHEDGLVHVSQLSHKFIKHPSEAVAIGDVVTVQVLDVDLKRQRIGLTMKIGEPPAAPSPVATTSKPGAPAGSSGLGLPSSRSGAGAPSKPAVVIRPVAPRLEPAKPSLEEQLKALQAKFNQR